MRAPHAVGEPPRSALAAAQTARAARILASCFEKVIRSGA
jgi:hypothetical protein